MALNIAITGGIASGKSIVSNHLLSLNIPIIDADKIAANLTQQPQIIQHLASLFGKHIIENNTLNRQKLASIVFNNPQNLKKLDDFIIPLIWKHSLEQFQLHQHKPILCYDAALLIEKNLHHYFPIVIAVITTPLLQAQRLITFRNDPNPFQKINAQSSNAEKLKHATHILYNTSSINKLIQQTNTLLQHIQNLHQINHHSL